MKKIIISVDTQGTPKIETEGYVGDACVKASASLILALGQTGEARRTEARVLPGGTE